MNEPTAPHTELWRARLRRWREKSMRVVPFATGVLATLVALLLYNALSPGPHQMTQDEVKNTVAQAMASATPAPAYSERVYKIIQPSLVLIQSNGKDSAGKEEHSLGSGVVIDDRGDILTALHVVSGATDIQLLFADGTKSSGKVSAKQPENDIAVLQADNPPKQIFPAVLGNPHAMSIGDEAFAVGNPFGLYGSMSAGVISGFERSVKPPNSDKELAGLIQIDAAVNPGNSGGPLLNRNGEVIGIVVGIINPTDQDFFVGIGFAVPITTAGGAAGSPPY